MAFGLEQIASERQEELQRAIAESRKAKNEQAAISLLLSALSDIRDALAESVIESVEVNNLDEVRAALRNELTKISKPIIQAIEALKMPADRLDAIKADIERKNFGALSESHDIQIVKKPRTRMTVDNLSDIQFPGSVNVSNLAEVQKYFDSLAQVVRDTFSIEIPTPQVTVNPPEVIVPEIRIPEIVIPEPNVNVQAPEFAPLLDAIKNLKDTIRRTAANNGKQMQAFSQGLNESSARKAFKAAIIGTISGQGSTELTDATAGAQLTATSTPCKYVDISTNAGLANIGSGTGAVQTSDGEVGVTIYPGNLPYRVHTTNVNLVYAAGATGTRLSWTYYN